MNIGDIFAWLKFMRETQTAKRPWTHHTKKGPGRKHQQTKTLTKEQRNGKIEAW